MSAPAPKQLPVADHRPIRRALLSVSDKSGVVELAQALHARGVTLLSTGGTAKALAAAKLPVVEVSAHTGFPEILDGRVKTLHPAIHGGILARRADDAHMAAIERAGIATIDLVVVNLYPFAATVASGADAETCVENIDVGGPAMIRAAAKNHGDVAVVTSTDQYPALLAELAASGGTSLALRRRLAAAAFAHTGAYDSAIAAWAAGALSGPGDAPAFPPAFAAVGTLRQTLRYGENPHQAAALYVDGTQRPGVARAAQLQGKELSYNNIGDTDAAYELAAEFDAPAIAIIKHGNPCGVAEGGDLASAYERALACDPVSAFGGIVAANRALDRATAERLAKLFLEVVIAPGFSPEALDVLKGKTNLRLLDAGTLPDRADRGMTVRSVAGGLLVQTRDFGRASAGELKVVTKRAPSEAERRDLIFAFRVAKHVKSNAIVLAKDGATVGIGAGQMSRVDSSRIAAWKAEEAGKAAGLAASPARGCVVASDAFFPFPDGLLAAAAAGATAVIQPGGSMRDADVIAAADAAGLAMVTTGLRHFRH
ncbi:MAG: bifunctional phosphoribosylaminoimidazolecarboxamide formyltransferase/IMP cyclohydrolase [Alphaproteobacteria bacterium]|nr:bifunctional phosphoribosylaminoimidazolecarboxamide formyltransferase/IMP cyclohydrolase [Alphaproteobacteria bacterium]